MPRYFKEGRKYDEYRLIKVYQSAHHCEIVLQAHEEYFIGKREKSAEKTATMIARSLGIVELIKKSELEYHKTGKKVIVFDENNYISEEDEVLAYQVFYFNRRIRKKKKVKRV